LLHTSSSRLASSGLERRLVPHSNWGDFLKDSPVEI
jgi:hypothetical protein